METLKSKFDLIIERLTLEGKVSDLDSEINDTILEKVSKELEEYRFNNQQKIKKSLEDISKVVLTA